MAGLLLVGDFHRAAGLSDEKPGTTIARLAKASNAEIRTVGSLNLKPLFDGAARMTDAQNQACLSAALDDVERESSHARPAAAAWAVGDLRGVRENSSASWWWIAAFFSCPASSPWWIKGRRRRWRPSTPP